MANPAIVNFLQEGLKRGFSENLLRHKLIEAGWQERDVNESIFEVKKQLAQNQTQIPMVVSSQREMMQDKQIMNKESNQEKLGVFRKIGMTLGKPNELFEKTQNEGIWPALKYYWVVSIIPFVIGGLVMFFLLNFVAAYISILSYSIWIVLVGFFALLYIAGPLVIFVSGGITHLFVKMFKGQGKYSNTFSSLVYSMTPQLLFFFIPFIGIWSLILNIFGIASYHKMPKGKAFLVLIIPAILIGIIAGVLFVLLGFSLPSGAS